MLAGGTRQQVAVVAAPQADAVGEARLELCPAGEVIAEIGVAQVIDAGLLVRRLLPQRRQHRLDDAFPGVAGVGL